jgi:hypothetical protein
MMMDTRPSTRQPTTADYLVCYALFVLLIILGVAVLVLIVRPAILVLIGALLGRSQWNRMAYLTSIALLGLGLFILVMAAEPYMRNGVKRGQHIRRFLRLAAPLVVAGALGFLVLTFI